MLTDIFATRYADRPIWAVVGERERVLLIQVWRIVAEQLMPYWRDKKVVEFNKTRWGLLQSKLSMEFGMESLSPLSWGYYDSNKVFQYGEFSMDAVCKTWMLLPYNSDSDPDRYMKARISFVELAFRDRMEAVAAISSGIPNFLQVALLEELRSGGTQKEVPRRMDAASAANAQTIALLEVYASELNERFRQAKAPLHYHNGFIQIESDQLTNDQIAAPFWQLLQDPKWSNVDLDMKEAIDRREANDRDPALYAAKALESTIKIICKEKGWLTGREGGAAAFIDNLSASKIGSFIETWEGEMLKKLFRDVRNPLGHGPGGEPMPQLTQEQTNWTIEAAMSWIKSLINRLNP